MNDEPGALIVTRRPAREMADGTLRVQIDVEPNDRRAFLNLFPNNGDPIAVAALTAESVLAFQQGNMIAAGKPSKGDHGKFAQWLVQSGFFRRPEVWRFLGTDKEFLEWLKGQRCAAHNIPECAGDVVPAHVRRIANGAGTGIKPTFSAVPLCDKHHKEQHAHGESVLGGKEFFDRQRIAAVSEWAKRKFKERAGVESLAAVGPYEFEATMRSSGININIPVEYF